MLKTIIKNRSFSIAIILGLFGIFMLISARVDMESEHTYVSLIMSTDDVQTLADLSGMSYDEYADTLLGAGLSSIFVPDEVDETLSLFIGDVYNGEDATVGLLEDNSQYSYIPIEGFEYSEEADVVRVFKLIPEYAARYAYLGYEGAEEIENLTYRTITDRNIRVIWLCPFIHSETGEVISNIDDYVSVIEGVGSRIEAQGLSLGQFSTLEGYTPNLWFILCAIVISIACSVLVAGTVININHKRRIIFLLAGFWFSCILWNIFPWLLPLVAATAFPCLGIWLVSELLLRMSIKNRKGAIIAYLKVLALAFAIAIIGGMAVGAMQSSRAYMLAVDNFRGVKVSQIVPILYAIYICYKTAYKGRSIREIISEYRGCSRVFFIALAIMAVVAVIYILRTSDGLFSAGVYEQRFRNWLENLLLVRPRTREFLFAWPALALAVSMLAIGSRRYAVPFTIFSAAALASIANTFCHSRSPIWLSFSRSLMGLALGAIFGVIIIYIVFELKKRGRLKLKK